MDLRVKGTFSVDTQVEFTLYASECGGYTAVTPDQGQGDELMKTKILALATVLIAIGATGASAATRLMGTGCCPLCR